MVAEVVRGRGEFIKRIICYAITFRLYPGRIIRKLFKDFFLGE